MIQHDNELYRLGAIYEKKGKFGKFIMKLRNKGDRGRELEYGRMVYSRHHYRESVIRAYNEEVIASWDK